MKKCFTLFACLASMIMPSLYARHLNPTEALHRVQKESPARLASFSRKSTVKLSATIGSLYLFKGDKGYLLVPDDDRALPLLAYSYDNNFDTIANPSLAAWLDFYNRELQSLSSVKESGKGLSAKDSRPERAPIAPLTRTEWNQEGPYNEMCPHVDGRGTVTGCVATAMAQVMKYHNYPSRGTGSHSYHWAPGDSTLSFNFGQTTFEWDLMTDTYNRDSSPESRKAVATLMLACGISVNMHYDVGDSGAASMTMGGALMDYFGYDKAIWMPMRDFYGLYEWEGMIYSDLEKGLPVLYAGSGTGGGHQFICDGYEGDGFFHFNWGWGGLSNGYYTLTALNPADLGVGGGAGGFNSGQQIALGVKPSTGMSSKTYLMYCTNHFLPAQNTVSPGQELKFKGDFYSYSLWALPEGSALGVVIESDNGADTRYIAGFGIDGLPGLRGYGEDRFRFPELPDGGYVIRPAFFDGTEWSVIPAPVGGIGSCDAMVKNGVAYLSSPVAASVTVVDIRLPSKLYMNREFPLHFTAHNPTRSEYLGKIVPVLIDPKTGKVIAQSQYRPLDVEPESDSRVTDYIGDFTGVRGEEYKPGEYLFVFHNEEGLALSTPMQIIVEPEPGETVFKVSDFNVYGKEPLTDKAAVRFDFRIACEQGYFTDRLHLYIFPGDGGDDIANHFSEMIYLPAGETAEGNIVIDLSRLVDGEYLAVLYKGADKVTDYLHFRLESNQGVTVIGKDVPESKIYDLNGVRHHEPLAPGIYIVNGRKIIILH